MPSLWSMLRSLTINFDMWFDLIPFICRYHAVDLSVGPKSQLRHQKQPVNHTAIRKISRFPEKSAGFFKEPSPLGAIGQSQAFYPGLSCRPVATSPVFARSKKALKASARPSWSVTTCQVEVGPRGRGILQRWKGISQKFPGKIW